MKNAGGGDAAARGAWFPAMAFTKFVTTAVVALFVVPIQHVIV